MILFKDHLSPLGKAFETAPNGFSRIYVKPSNLWKRLCTAYSHRNKTFWLFIGWFDLKSRSRSIKIGRKSRFVLGNLHCSLIFFFRGDDRQRNY